MSEVVQEAEGLTSINNSVFCLKRDTGNSNPSNPLEDQLSPDPLVTMHVAGKQHEKKQMVAVVPGQLVQFTRGHFYYVSDCLDIER